MKNKLIKKLNTPSRKQYNTPWIFWQRKAQTHPALNLIYKYEKWGNVWSNEIEILEDGIKCFRFALSYKNRGYHKFHRIHVKDAKLLIKKLKNKQEENTK